MPNQINAVARFPLRPPRYAGGGTTVALKLNSALSVTVSGGFVKLQRL